MFKKDWDWQEVLGYAGKDTTYAGPCRAVTPVGENPPPADPFGMEDIAEILAADPGEPDGREWMCALKLIDGRYAYIQAGCDYTGWDCQADGSAWVASDRDSLIRWALTDPARHRLGLSLSHGAGRYFAFLK